jgi:hypothetical protein
MRTSARFEVRTDGNHNAKYTNTNNFWIQVIGRLRPGVTQAQAQSALMPIFQDLEGDSTIAD